MKKQPKAEDKKCAASGDHAHAEGILTQAAAEASHAEGRYTKAEDEPAYGKTAEGAHVEGTATRASGWSGHAEGTASWAEGLIAHAQNCISLAAGNDSHTEGVQTITGRRRYFINPRDQGMASLKSHGSRPYFIVRADADLNPAGDYTPEFIDAPIIITNGCHTINPQGTTPAFNRHPTVVLFSTAEVPPGKYTVLRSQYDPANRLTRVFYDNPEPAFPEPQTIMMACASYAPEGNDSTYSDGKGQHAEGKRSNAAGNFAHAEGRDTTCFGRYSHAEGYLTKVNGEYGAHAEGEATLASGNRSHAEGGGTSAGGNAAHAEGWKTVARGDHSHAGGLETKAVHPGAIIVGKYGETSCPYAWHLADGTGARPKVACRIDGQALHHSGCLGTGGNGYAETFAWADGNASGEDRLGIFVSVRGDKIVKAEPDDFVLGVVTATPGVVAGEMEFGCRDRVAVGMIGRLSVRDNGNCRPDSYCKAGPGGLAAPADSGWRVLRRTGPTAIEIVFK
ncbi:MAG: peptidase G2 autoproteolytic cleavage domain-containing protein [Kiritimatiellae bacterium]|nr:peptidase G2 autoproteolytic cleavage domain-containing protein [Kiritimatiellia bacterium]